MLGAILGALAAAAWFVYLVRPRPALGVGLDASWQHALTLALHDHLRFGHDIVFTYGPLGFVLAGPADATLAIPQLIVSSVVAFVVAAAALFALGGRSSVLQKTVAALALLVYSSNAGLDYVSLAGALALLVRASRFPRCAVATGAGIGLLSLFGFLSKYTVAMDVLGAAAAVWIVDLATGPAERRRAALTAGAIALATVLVGSLVALRSPAALVEYARGALAITDGYSAAMALPGSWTQVLLAGAVALALLLVGVRAARERQPTLLAMSAVTLFLAWKHGYVRQDGHFVIYFGAAFALAAILVVAVRRRGTVVIALAAFAVATFAYVVSFQSATNELPHFFVVERWRDAARFLVSPRQVTAENAAQEPTMLADDDLPPAFRARLGNGTVDVLPVETAIVAANDLHWDPLPVFQSYSAYTPYLDELNRTALDEHGADTILYQYIAIDGRLPFGEAPATTVALLCRYRGEPVPLGVGTNAFLVLHRAPNATCASADAGTVDASIGTPVAVPAPHGPREMIVASIDLRPTLLCRVANALWRAPFVFLDVTYGDGSTARFRAVVATLRDGIVIAPAPRSQDEAEAFITERSQTPVKSVTVVAPAAFYSLSHVTFTREVRSRAKS
ncbi:MAG TPA: hypothetical protein VMD91_07115 [Candidatus Sulfotelmatobacter sp.]|nr:hypothetical protein [Candidatus Sulfotelmatobacter sp.]